MGSCRSGNTITKTLADFQLQDFEAAAPKEEFEEKAEPNVSQKIVALDKDNVYYKQTNRNLKRKLREMINAWDTEKQVCFLLLQGLKSFFIPRVIW